MTQKTQWEQAFDDWPGWRGNDPIRQAFQAGWDAALASHAPSDPQQEGFLLRKTPSTDVPYPSEAAAQPTNLEQIADCERVTSHAQVPGTGFCRCTHVMYD